MAHDVNAFSHLTLPVKFKERSAVNVRVRTGQQLLAPNVPANAVTCFVKPSTPLAAPRSQRLMHTCCDGCFNGVPKPVAVNIWP
jgi:hypothetical protein